METDEFDDSLSSLNREYKALSITHDINQLPIGRWGIVKLELKSQRPDTVQLVADGGNALDILLDPPVLQMQPNDPTLIRVQVRRNGLLAIPAGGAANVTLMASTLDGVAQAKKDIPVWVRRRYEGLLIAILLMLCPVATILSILAVGSISPPPTPTAIVIVAISTTVPTVLPTLTASFTPSSTSIPPTVTPTFTPTFTPTPTNTPTITPTLPDSCERRVAEEHWSYITFEAGWTISRGLGKPFNSEIAQLVVVLNNLNPNDIQPGTQVCVPYWNPEHATDGGSSGGGAGGFSITGLVISGNTAICNQPFTIEINVHNSGNISSQPVTVEVQDVHLRTGERRLLGQVTIPAISPNDDYLDKNLTGTVDIYYNEEHELQGLINGQPQGTTYRYTLQQGNCGVTSIKLPVANFYYALNNAHGYCGGAHDEIHFTNTSENSASYQWDYTIQFRERDSDDWGYPTAYNTSSQDLTVTILLDDYHSQYRIQATLTAFGGGASSQKTDVVIDKPMCYWAL